MNELLETDADRENRIRKMGAQKALGVAADVLAHVRALVTAGYASEGGVEVRVERTPLHTGRVDDADAAFVQLADWVEFWGEQFKAAYPRTTRTWRSGEWMGFTAGTGPARARMQVQHFTLWLSARLEQIHIHPSGAEFEADVMRIVFSLRARYPMAPGPERLVHPRPCPECGEAGVHAWWRSGDVLDVQIRCEVCGHELAASPYEIERWLS